MILEKMEKTENWISTVAKHILVFIATFTLASVLFWGCENDNRVTVVTPTEVEYVTDTVYITDTIYIEMQCDQCNNHWHHGHGNRGD